MRNKFYLFALIIFSLFNTKIAKSNEPTTSVNGPFTSIELKTFANVLVTQGNECKAWIKPEDLSTSKIILEVVNGKLIISTPDDKESTIKTTVIVNIKDLEKVELAGSGNIKFQNQIKSNSMELKISGSGNLKANLASNDVKITVAGSGNAELEGKTDFSDIKLTGSGNVDARKMKTSKSKIKLTGSGTSTVDVENELDGEITGSGNIYFITIPGKVNAVSYGSGKIERLKA
jgi:hypothetical protein